MFFLINTTNDKERNRNPQHPAHSLSNQSLTNSKSLHPMIWNRLLQVFRAIATQFCCDCESEKWKLFMQSSKYWIYICVVISDRSIKVEVKMSAGLSDCGYSSDRSEKGESVNDEKPFSRVTRSRKGFQKYLIFGLFSLIDLVIFTKEFLYYFLRPKVWHQFPGHSK